MNGLHRIETSRGGPGSDPAGTLVYVRKALSELQASGVHHVAVDQATEAIAGALGMVHQLSGLVGQASVVPSPPTQPSNAFQAAGEMAPQVAVVNQPHWQQPAPAAVNPVAATQVAPNWGLQTAPAGQAWHPPPEAAPQPAPPQAWQQPAPAAAPAYPAAAHQPAPAPTAGPGGSLRYEAELGAHSSTNFYKGLSGNDVIDSGGIFIATYNIPDVGQALSVKVSLPGGYEFEAAAVVRWTRDSPQSGADSSPGFGAQFTQISAEGRQLVYRYVRNREPLFYDDL
jgi:PilZ domain